MFLWIRIQAENMLLIKWIVIQGREFFNHGINLGKQWTAIDQARQLLWLVVAQLKKKKKSNISFYLTK